MKYLRSTLRVGYLVASFVLLLSLQPQFGHADQPAGLRFRELKITDIEFVVLQNNGKNQLQMSDFWLGYASNDQATNIVPSQQLPAGVLNPNEAIVLTNDATDTCDASVVSGLDFSSLSDTKGTLVLRYLQNNGATSTFTTIDKVNWSKPSATGSTTDNIDLRNEKGLTVPVWYKANDTTQWQVGDYDACSLLITTVTNGAAVASTQTIVWSQASSVVPGTIISLATSTSGATGKSLPAADRGLKSPQMSEIFPNPASPKTDADDEFVELYNPNNKPFDLTGFTIQTGSTTSSTRRNFELPKGTLIPAKSFKALYSKQTGLQINNTGGQVWLLDPFGTVIAKTDPYSKPKEGAAWATARGKWYFTVTPTPGAANRINEPAVKSAKTSSSVAKTSQGTPVTAVAASNNVSSAKNASYGGGNTEPKAAIHPLTLAVVIGLALLYGAYEYRHDLANRINQLRANRNTRT